MWCTSEILWQGAHCKWRALHFKMVEIEDLFCWTQRFKQASGENDISSLQYNWELILKKENTLNEEGRTEWMNEWMNYVLLIFLKDLKKRPNRFQMFKKRLKNASFNLFNMSMWGFSCAATHCAVTYQERNKQSTPWLSISALAAVYAALMYEHDSSIQHRPKSY